MKICPRCRAKHASPDDEFCAHDGARLVLERDLELDDMVGRVVAGRFEVVGIIGAGGMGTVYEAVQTPLDRRVALKVLRRDLTGDRVAVGRFRREAKAASLLTSRHTVTLYEAGEDDDETLFLAMERLQGRSLSGRLFDRGALPWREAVDIARQITESLTEAHEKGIVHRDLKPEHIYLADEPTGDGHGGRGTCVKVLDFGIAILTRPERGAEIGLTRTGVIVGTPGYMSPEQAKGLRADGRSDVYSLGCLLYEMLTGKPPFESTEAVLLMGKHISAPVPPFELRIPRGEVPDAVEAVVVQMLEKDPADRIQTAREARAVFAGLLDGTYAPPPALLDRMRATGGGPRRGRTGLLAGVVAATLIVAAAAGAYVGTRGDGRATAVDTAAATAPRAGTAGAGGDGSGNAAADAATETVEVEVVARPESARILLDGEAVGGNPWSAKLPRSRVARRLAIEAEGYRGQQLDLRLDADQRLVISLEREVADGGTAPAPAAGSAPPRPPRGARGARPAKRPGGVGLELDTSFPTGT
jgi:serine/threonine-protein kinase